MTTTGQGFFRSLFAYKQRTDRSPFEDFITEIVCELFREASREGCIGYFLGRLLQPNDPDITLVGHADIKWQAQYYIGEGPSEAQGKRPDLVGRGKLGNQSVLFLFEHKVDAQQSYYDFGDDVRLSQLQVYASWVANQPEALKEVAYVTRSKPLFPDMPSVRPISWFRYSAVLREFNALGQASCPRTRYLSEKFCELLEASHMASVNIGVVDVVSYEPWKKLRSAIDAVGQTWPILENHPLRERLEKAGFGVTHGGTYAEWRSGQNRVTILTPLDPDGKPMRAEDSFAHFYAGVVLDGYGAWVEPMHKGLPSFAVGFTLLLTRTLWDNNCKRLEALVDRLNGEARNGRVWRLTHNNTDQDGIRNDSGDWRTINLVCEKSFFDALHQWGSEWTDQPQIFFVEAFRRIEEVFSSEDLELLVQLARAAEAAYPSDPSEGR